MTTTTSLLARLDDKTKEYLRERLGDIRRSAMNDEATIKQQSERIHLLEDAVTKAHSTLLEIRKEVLTQNAMTSGEAFRQHVRRELATVRAHIVKLNESYAKELQKLGAPANVVSAFETQEETKDNERASYPLRRSVLYTAAVTAIESRRPDDGQRLVFDPLAEHFAGKYGFDFAENFAKDLSVTEEYLATFAGFRTHYFDEQIVKAVKDGGIKQLVIVGGAADTRAFRMKDKLPSNVTIYAMDSAEALAYRKQVLSSAKAGSPSVTVKTVMADVINDSNAMSSLKSMGYNKEEKSAFVFEGVLQYLSESKCNAVLKSVADSAAKGSVIIGDLPNKTNVNLRLLHDTWERYAEPVLFGLDTPEKMLEGLGFKKQSLEMLGYESTNYFKRAPEMFTQHMASNPRSEPDQVARIYLFAFSL